MITLGGERVKTSVRVSPQIVLTGGAVLAGDYEVSLPGVYGDDLPLPEANRELVPLLQRLIKLLQEGMPVMMNSAGQVVAGGYSIFGAGEGQVSQLAATQPGGMIGRGGPSQAAGVSYGRESMPRDHMAFPSVACGGRVDLI